MIERVHREARGERIDVADPVLPRAHPAVEEDDVRALPAALHRDAHRKSSASTILRA